MEKKHAIILGAIGIAAVIIGGIFLLTPSRPMFGILPEVKGEGVLGVYELWWSHENYLNAEVEVEGDHRKKATRYHHPHFTKTHIPIQLAFFFEADRVEIFDLFL
ncbi:unnamed protein product [marine sediment metagenome]|uniref:Uncharacterized protein n=1 Tax=marine sediment metagenome TaxID=412755 RepID=X1R0B5_9ZZZZ